MIVVAAVLRKQLFAVYYYIAMVRSVCLNLSLGIKNNFL